MPRSLRRATEGPEASALDASRRVYDETERRLEEARADLLAKTIAAVKAGMPKAEAGRRAGYSREYVSKLFNDAIRAEHDGGDDL